MEKILRKVSCKDRLPNIEGMNYYTELGEFSFINKKFVPNQLYLSLTRQPEYWYEEVDLKQAFEEAFQLEFIDNAKERYDKALSFYEISEDVDLRDLDNTVRKALRIASGLEEV